MNQFLLFLISLQLLQLHVEARNFQTLTSQSTPSQQSQVVPQAPTVAKLELGKRVERELAGPQKHAYQVALTEGQYAKLTAEQQGVDVIAHLFTPDGQLLADVDSVRTVQGIETLELVAEVDGSYRIEIELRAAGSQPGMYVVELNDVHPATEDERLLHDARKHYYESFRLIDSGNARKAIDSANRALIIREKILGPSHADVAASLLALGTFYSSSADFTRAEDVLQRAAEATAKVSGMDSLDYADVVHAQAQLRFSQGEHTQAEQLNQRALSIREKVAGRESLPAASSLVNLAVLYRTTSDLPRAEQMYLKALAIREKLLGPDHLEVSILLNFLGLLYYGAGDYDDAEPILQRSLTIKEKVLGPNHRQVATALNNLGLVEWKRKNFEKAEGYHRRAMSVYEKAAGAESYGVGSSLHNLGILYKEVRHDYAKAEEYYRRALAIWQKLFGDNHASTATVLTSLGLLYEAMGDFDQALTLHLHANAIYEKLLGPNNHYTLLTLRSLADVYAIKGDIERAMEYQRRIGGVEDKIMPLNLTIGSERQKIAYFTQLQTLDSVISFHVGIARDEATARDLAVTKILQRKGRVLDALSLSLAALRRRFNAQDQLTLDHIADINSRISRLVLSGPQRVSPGEHQNQIKILEGEREKLEAEVGRLSAGFYEGSLPITLASVKAAIPKGAALVEFTAYRPANLRAVDDKGRYGEPRYVAYVIRGNEEVRWVELGAAQEIDRAVGSLRQALRDPQRTDVQQLARALDDKLMRPVRALVGESTQLLISPDGQLNLLPFAALVDEQGRYLIEHYSFSYLTSGRDLLRLQTARASKGNPLVVADPSFGEPIKGQTASAVAWPASQADGQTSVTSARDLTEVYFAPLDGTELEANTIKRLFPEASLLAGPNATESALKRIAAPKLLHIATHGFFLGDTPSSRTPNAQVAIRGISATAKIQNPLLRSGLALAGANRRTDGGDDGILTALEASGLNLWGTKLVVLSACDTGVGEVRNGEGVYGLRRAFVLAGAESLVMSLWPASDYTTRKLMTEYYKNLKQGIGRGAALRDVQLNMLKRNKNLHPFYWANFIQSGEWANLDGKR